MSTFSSTSRISVTTLASLGTGPSIAHENDCCALRRAGGTRTPNQYSGFGERLLPLDLEVDGGFSVGFSSFSESEPPVWDSWFCSSVSSVGAGVIVFISKVALDSVDFKAWRSCWDIGSFLIVVFPSDGCGHVIVLIGDD